MKNIKKRLSSLFVFVWCCSLRSIVYAKQIEDVIQDLKSGQGVYGVLYRIIQILLWLGVVVAIAKMMHIGYKYLTQPAGGRSQAKESIAPWFVGAIILALFGSIGPWIIYYIEPDSSTGIFDI